ncbi:NAD(P)H-dependent oxidoreductase [Nocardia cyriacigeorgica]|uniref:NAD(P)H-dependent oxidoreductase n=1 Tax=Nocardia cyriacigeorgica TaxID=135487 RepID=UPI001E514C71|nr:NAD(P)H-dependent oxidoreductase [Nocardia cyriacigeorgica]
MKTLIVHAHPEPASLNGALKDLAVTTLETAGHEVRVSDLYAMNWTGCSPIASPTASASTATPSTANATAKAPWPAAGHCCR